MFTCNVGGSLFQALSLRPEFHVALFVLGGMVRYVPALYVKLLQLTLNSRPSNNGCLTQSKPLCSDVLRIDLLTMFMYCYQPNLRIF
jgi:hypothetical protein